MPFVIEESLEIDAPASIVWEVIVDLPRYQEWNPFVVQCQSTLEVGDPIEMRVRVFRSFAQSQSETITEHVPGERLCYGVVGMPLGLLASRRSHEVRALDSGRTAYRSYFELSGCLATLVRALLGKRLARGFHAMTAAIRKRAEELARSGRK